MNLPSYGSQLFRAQRSVCIYVHMRMEVCVLSWLPSKCNTKSRYASQTWLSKVRHLNVDFGPGCQKGFTVVPSNDSLELLKHIMEGTVLQLKHMVYDSGWCRERRKELEWILKRKDQDTNPTAVHRKTVFECIDTWIRLQKIHRQVDCTERRGGQDMMLHEGSSRSGPGSIQLSGWLITKGRQGSGHKGRVCALALKEWLLHLPTLPCVNR